MLDTPSTLPPDTPPALHEALAEARTRLADLYGERLRRVVLYGSRARGDARPDSDVDLLVVLSDDTSSYADARSAAEIEMDLYERYRLPFSLVLYREAELAHASGFFVHNLQQDGVEL